MVFAQLTGRLTHRPRPHVQVANVVAPVRQHDLPRLGMLLPRRIPPGDDGRLRVVESGMSLHHAGPLVARQRRRREPGRQLARRLLLPVLPLPADLGDLHRPDPLGDRPERRAGLDRLQLLRIPDQHHLRAGSLRVRQQPLHLPRADHPGLVHHQHVARGEFFPALLPLEQQAVHRPARDPRPGLQLLRGNPRQRRAAHLIAIRFPGLARHPEHRALAGAGVTHHHAEIPRLRHVPERQHLLSPQRGRLRQTPAAQVHPVRLPLGEFARRMLHALLGRQHLPRGEPVLPAPVHTEPHHLGRRLHFRHRLGELLGIRRVPVHHSRQVAPREGRLLPRQRPEYQRRIGDDPFPVPPRQGFVIRRPLRFLAARRAPCPRGADLVLRLQRDALLGMRPMIDPEIVPQLRQTLVRQLGPALAPAHQLLGAVPLPRLLAEPLRPNLAHRQHDMRVRLVLAARRAAPVHVQVRHHAVRHELLAHEILRQPNRVGLGKLPRERKLDLTRKLRVLAFLARLDLVPQRRPVQQTRRRTIGEENLRMHHAGLVGEVVRPAEPLVVQLLGRSIGCRRDRAAPVRTADHLRREMVDRHGQNGSDRSVSRGCPCDVAKQRISAHSGNRLRFTPP